VVNVTVANASADGFFTVWGCDDPMPGTSNGNFVGVSTIANNVVVSVDGSGEICVRLGQADGEVMVDLMGFVLEASGYEPLAAPGSLRLFDSRHAAESDGVVRAGEPVRLELDGLVDGAESVVVNVTAANATADGFFTVWNCDGEVPGTSNGNFVGVSTIANNVMTAVEDGSLCVQLGQADAELIVDLFGSFPAE
jgi:hypothetical protein